MPRDVPVLPVRARSKGFVNDSGAFLLFQLIMCGNVIMQGVYAEVRGGSGFDFVTDDANKCAFSFFYSLVFLL